MKTSKENTRGKLSLEKMQIAKITNLSAINGGNGGGGEDGGKTKTTQVNDEVQNGFLRS